MKNFVTGAIAIACFAVVLFGLGHLTCWTITIPACNQSGGSALAGVIALSVLGCTWFIPWSLGSMINGDI